MKKFALLSISLNIILLIIFLNYNGNILFRGQEVPSWIEKVTFSTPCNKKMILISLFAIAYKTKEYVAVHTFFVDKENNAAMYIDGCNNDITVAGAPTHIIMHFTDIQI